METTRVGSDSGDLRASVLLWGLLLTAGCDVQSPNMDDLGLTPGISGVICSAFLRPTNSRRSSLARRRTSSLTLPPPRLQTVSEISEAFCSSATSSERGKTSKGLKPYLFAGSANAMTLSLVTGLLKKPPPVAVMTTYWRPSWP